MIHFVPEVGSTNHVLAARLADGEHVREGEWLVADRQTMGLGRSGRAWQDGDGNFMGSTIVHPNFGDPAAPTLSLVAGLAVHTVIRELLAGEPHLPLLKWPNDVLIGDAKLAGILLERSCDAVIVGVGVNIASTPDVNGRKTSALWQLGATCERDVFADLLAAQFALDLERWRSFGMAPTVQRWLAVAHPLGTALSIVGPEGALGGTFAGLQDDGALRLRLASGEHRVLYSGEVGLAQETLAARALAAGAQG